ncbi:LacI family DNA-binding transcriptional regulator [Microbacterium radiodurans]|uniref:LacI family DNA-binding transcriptional regulator n=1 Tax=Microbacterium radiodurans TaxID=661398 RepID=UPI001CC715D2|nr:LacI family DNA-binding transcriptional regulator [Microbacterium radiodurans]
MGSTVGIDEVARAAGVSISTVSYALSGKRPVSVATRQRVERAVADLGYSPNARARMLAARRTQIFALTEPLRPDTHAPTHMAFVLAASIAARRKEYDILLLTEAEASAGMQRVADSGLVDAILVLDVAPNDERVGLSRAIDTPTVFIGVPTDTAGLVCVDLDFAAATRRAVDALADAGHTRIGLLGHTPEAYELSNFPPRVRDAFRHCSAERGVTAQVRIPDGPGAASERFRRAASDLIEGGATGILVQGNEEAHLSVLAEAERRGLRIPADLSLLSLAATHDTGSLPVPLTAIPLVPQDSCDLAVELAARLAAGEKVAPGIRLIDPLFVDRGSIASPAASPTRPTA